MDQLIPLGIIGILLVFWFWMFRDMIRDEYMSDWERLQWTVGFVVLSLPTAGFYYFVMYRKKH